MNFSLVDQPIRSLRDSEGKNTALKWQKRADKFMRAGQRDASQQASENGHRPASQPASQLVAAAAAWKKSERWNWPSFLSAACIVLFDLLLASKRRVCIQAARVYSLTHIHYSLLSRHHRRS